MFLFNTYKSFKPLIEIISTFFKNSGSVENFILLLKVKVKVKVIHYLEGTVLVLAFPANINYIL